MDSDKWRVVGGGWRVVSGGWSGWWVVGVVWGWLDCICSLECVVYGLSRHSPGCKILHFPILRKFYCKEKCKMAGWFYCKFTNPGDDVRLPSLHRSGGYTRARA